uniref:Uncharacterized protein n=1 Tax=Scleropages formosus TaxID=113540 RepID=A0A8C9VJ94_SCLFO
MFRQLVVVKAGDVLKINADIAGRPHPVVLWAKDGKEIEAKARVEISSSNFCTTIIVKDCIRRDSGQYVLTLQNVAGTRSVAVNCKVLDRPGPSAGPLQVTVIDTTRTSVSLAWSPPEEEGGSSIIGYLIEMQKIDQIEWTKCNTTPVKICEYTLTHMPQGAEYRFRVMACNAGGPGEPAEVPGAVKVTEMLGESRNTTYSGEFECEVSREDAEGTWYFEGKEITPSSKYVMSSRRGRHSLCVRDVKKEDQGKYSFVVGDLKTNIEVPETQVASFECEVSHFNVPSTWLKNGVEIEMSEKFRIVVQGKLHQLKIMNTSREDSAEYTFICGNDKVSATLTVNRKSLDTITFEVNVNYEGITYKWLKNGVEIRSTERCHIRSKQLTHSLTIRNVHFGDVGEYQFVAGSAATSANLYVDGKYSLYVVYFSFLCGIFRYKVSTEKYLHRLMIQTVRLSDAGEYCVVAGSSTSKAQLTVEGRDVRITDLVEKEITVNINSLWLKWKRRKSVSLVYRIIF